MQQIAPSAYLIIQSGGRWTDVLKLQADQSVIVGRASDNQVVVRDERVSRQHAEIAASKGGWEVRDLGSRNGTQVNGLTIASPHRLQDGETIQVGNCSLVYSGSLAEAFAVRSEQGPSDGGDGQQTLSIDAPPTIVQRQSRSRWSSDRFPPQAALGGGVSPPVLGADQWSFFYRLIFDLVTCKTAEQAAQVALERLLEQLRLSAGGVVTVAPVSAPHHDDQATGDNEQVRQKELASPTVGSHPDKQDDRLEASYQPSAMAVLATRQAAGECYHRVSDFLVRTVLRERQAVLARNVKDDSHLSLARESARRDVVSIICAPLRVRMASEQQVIGLLHVYSSGDERMLSDVDLELTVAVADNLAIALTRLSENQRLNKSLETTRRKLDQLQQQLEEASELIGTSNVMQQVRQSIQRAGPSVATVLVRGESGVGKELVARAVHRASPRRDGPLACLNCAALAPTLLESELFGHEKGAFTGATERKIGKFEAADGGTLLLDEVGEMHPDLQAKFLRVLEGHPFERLGGNRPIKTDVRVIAATNRDLEEAVKAKEFRSDLYYRLRVVEIIVPPLRARLEDIPQLVEFFFNQLRSHAGRRIEGVEPAALELLSRHSWPGNVRELRNVIERAIVLGVHPTLQVEDMNISSLAAHESGAGEGAFDFRPVSLADLEKKHIFEMLKFTEGNKSKASQLLGIERSTLDRKLKRYEP